MKCKYKESCGYEFCLDDCCPEFEAAVEINADRIRAMSDEELAAFFDEPELCKGKALTDCMYKGCKMCILEWLKQPAEGE